MKENMKKSLGLIGILAVLGQMVFFFASTSYTKPTYINRVFATTGIQFDSGNLHKLNEGAHYFGQTMIGWTRFPSFKPEMLAKTGLELADINMHIQERQNIILTLQTDSPIDLDTLREAKNFLSAKIEEYNESTNTKFVLTNVDYQQYEQRRSYGLGAFVSLILSVVVALGVLFVRKEFFKPRLKF